MHTALKRAAYALLLEKQGQSKVRNRNRNIERNRRKNTARNVGKNASWSSGSGTSRSRRGDRITPAQVALMVGSHNDMDGT